MQEILLGFLILYGENTSYEIKKAMEISTSMFYNSSLGSINPAFKKLQKNGLVTVTEVIKNGRLKKIYSITDKGKINFLEWMEKDIEVQRIKSEVLLKLFFFSLIEKGKRVKLLDDYLIKIEQVILKLESISKLEELNSCSDFELDTLDFGLEYYKFLYQWFKDYKNKI